MSRLLDVFAVGMVIIGIALWSVPWGFVTAGVGVAVLNWAWDEPSG